MFWQSPRPYGIDFGGAAAHAGAPPLVPNETLHIVDELCHADFVEGVILVSSRLSTARIAEYTARLPLVLVNRDEEGIARVLIDSASGVSDAVNHLTGLGHRNIAYLSGPRFSWSNEQRQGAVTRMAGKLGLRLTTLSSHKATFDSGRQTADALLASNATAAICFDDLLAQGLMAGLAERRVPVPEAISIVGCDDVLGAATYPTLTTVSSRSVEAGTTAAALLMEMMENHADHNRRRVLGTQVIARETTAVVRSG